MRSSGSRFTSSTTSRASVGSVIKPAGFENSQGIISAAYLKDASDPQWDNDAGMKTFLDFLAKDFPEGDKLDASVIVGYAVAQTMVQVLKQCGDDLTRENIMKQAASLKDFRTEVLLPGITINTSPTDFAPISQLQLMRFKGETMGAVRRHHLRRRRRLIAASYRPTGHHQSPPQARLRGFSFAADRMDKGLACPWPSLADLMTDRRPLLRAIFDAAIAAAHPDVVLAQHLRPVPKGRVICLAAGKGAAAMAAAAEKHYLDALELEPSRLVGIATTRHGHGVPTRRIRVVEAGHPMPDEAGLKGAEDTLRLAQTAEADDLLLVLLSGGGSANWIAPAEGITFEQKQKLTRALLRSGAPIGEVNTVRKHLSRIKGGRLARAGQRAEIVTLAISDVPRDDPSAIASGPTVPDPTTLADARAIVAKYRLDVDDAIRRALENPANESCKPGDAAFARASFELIARPRQSLDAAIKLARDAGYEIVDLGADLEGEAREVAADHARLALKRAAKASASRSSPAAS